MNRSMSCNDPYHIYDMQSFKNHQTEPIFEKFS